MLITEQSLVERLDGRAGDPRRRCRLFIPDQAVFIRDQPPFIQCWVYCHPDDSGPTERAAGSPSRRRQVTGRRCAGEEVARPTGMAAAVARVDGAAQADGTDNAPTEEPRPILAETAGAPAPK